MKLLVSGGMCVAAVAALFSVASAQTTGQTPAQPQAPAPAAATAQSDKTPEQQVTIIGCVQREADYRRAQDKGRGGVAGTGVGVQNEFVLVNASMPTASTGTAPTGTAGTSAPTETAYELTGKNEPQVEKYVGRRVEIVGTLKAAEIAATGRPTGGATAGTPPTGVDVASKDLKLRELDVSSVREATGTCPAM